jgi:CheY-like chemotaxis protein
MPGMDGFELCKKMSAMSGYQQTPVISVASHIDLKAAPKAC